MYPPKTLLAELLEYLGVQSAGFNQRGCDNIRQLGGCALSCGERPSKWSPENVREGDCLTVLAMKYEVEAAFFFSTCSHRTPCDTPCASMVTQCCQSPEVPFGTGKLARGRGS